MKKKFLTYFFLCVVLTGLPLIPAKCIRPHTTQADAVPEETTESEPPTTEAIKSERIYHVLDTESGQILEIPLRSYLIGAVGAEMPVSFEQEALKAQVIASHTYAERQAAFADQHPELNGADFSDDPDQYQAFYTEEELKNLYQENFDLYYQKLADAVDAVQDEILIYEDQPIIAAFHAISAGKTESAANVWGNEIAYLQSVDSEEDLNAPQFMQSVSYTPDEVRERLEASRTGLFLGTDIAHWFGEPFCSDAGTVLQISVGTSIFTGQELRSIFSLRSAAFKIRYEDRKFIFTTNGYGHDVGMSQYGANAMACNGADYQEILMHYYPGAILEKAR